MTNTVISGYSTMQVLFCLLSVAALFYRESIIQFNSNSFICCSCCCVVVVVVVVIVVVVVHLE